MTDTIQSAAMTDLHAAIMNIQADHEKAHDDYKTKREAYIFGHRDARHAAAELAALAARPVTPTVLVVDGATSLWIDGAKVAQWTRELSTEEVISLIENPWCMFKPASAPKFPTMLRKMWSGGEVQAWINEHLPTTPASAPGAPEADKPLPEPAGFVRIIGGAQEKIYTAEQMRAHAKAAKEHEYRKGFIDGQIDMRAAALAAPSTPAATKDES